MNYKLIGLLLTSSLALGQSLPTSQILYPYSIKGEIAQLVSPAKVYLIDGMNLVDSADVKHGYFKLSGITIFPHPVSLVLARERDLLASKHGKKFDSISRQASIKLLDRVNLFLEPNIILTSADTNSLKKSRIHGSRINTDYQKLNESIGPILAKRRQNDSELQYKKITEEYVRAIITFVKAHPASWVSLGALEQARLRITPQYAEVAPLYASFTPAQRTSPIGYHYGKILAGLKANILNTRSPNFKLYTSSGQLKSLSDYLGKYVLIDFWASWCIPCRAEHPTLRRAYKIFKERNFEILGVSLDNKDNRNSWIQAINKDSLTWVQMTCPQGFNSAVAQDYGIIAIPQNFLIDPAGNIVATNLRGEAIIDMIAKFIQQ